MDEPKISNAGQGFGVAGFVMGLIALILSFIPCLGMYALIPGIIAIIFSTIAFIQANMANASKGLIIAALIISILGSLIASWQFVTIRRAASNFKSFGTDFKETFRDDFGDEIKNNIRRALEGMEDYQEHDTITVDTLGFDAEEMIEQLERLEGERINE